MCSVMFFRVCLFKWEPIEPHTEIAYIKKDFFRFILI